MSEAANGMSKFPPSRLQKVGPPSRREERLWFHSPEERLNGRAGISADAGGMGAWPPLSLPPSSSPIRTCPHSLLLSCVSLMLVELGLVWAARDLPSSVKNGVGSPCPPQDSFSEGSCRVSSGNTQLMLAVILSSYRRLV